jgi:hypothetical protein
MWTGLNWLRMWSCGSVSIQSYWIKLLTYLASTVSQMRQTIKIPTKTNAEKFRYGVQHIFNCNGNTLTFLLQRYASIVNWVVMLSSLLHTQSTFSPLWKPQISCQDCATETV